MREPCSSPFDHGERTVLGASLILDFRQSRPDHVFHRVEYPIASQEKRRADARRSWYLHEVNRNSGVAATADRHHAQQASARERGERSGNRNLRELRQVSNRGVAETLVEIGDV